MWRPSATRMRTNKISNTIRLCATTASFIAALSAYRSFEAFTSVPQQQRPAGSVAVVEKLPRGMVCRAAYGDSDREEWSPLPQWRGEKTYHPNADLQADENRQWYHFDAEGKVLGHLAQAIAAVLRGKDNPLYDPIRDVGAFVIVTNCEKVRVSGKKYHYKLYFRNLSFRPGHLKVERFKDLQKRFPERIIMRAVWGSMPKTPSCRRIFKDRLKLFSGPNHLYYHENPVEYPMHTVKDCTHTQNTRRRDRIMQWFNNIAPRNVKRAEVLQTRDDAIRLERFKRFLREQFKRDGPEELERMKIQELAQKADKERMAKVVKKWEGKEIPKKPVAMYLGTNIPRKRISGNKR